MKLTLELDTAEAKTPEVATDLAHRAHVIVGAFYGTGCAQATELKPWSQATNRFGEVVGTSGFYPTVDMSTVASRAADSYHHAEATNPLPVGGDVDPAPVSGQEAPAQALSADDVAQAQAAVLTEALVSAKAPRKARGPNKAQATPEPTIANDPRQTPLDLTSALAGVAGPALTTVGLQPSAPPPVAAISLLDALTAGAVQPTQAAAPAPVVQTLTTPHTVLAPPQAVQAPILEPVTPTSTVQAPEPETPAEPTAYDHMDAEGLRLEILARVKLPGHGPKWLRDTLMASPGAHSVTALPRAASIAALVDSDFLQMTA